MATRPEARPETQSRSLTQVAGAQVLEPSVAACPSLQEQEVEPAAKLRIQRTHGEMGCGCSSWVLSIRSVLVPEVDSLIPTLQMEKLRLREAL